MRRALSLTVALLLAGGLAAPAFAQATPQVIISHEMTNEDLNTAELAAFDQVANARISRCRGGSRPIRVWSTATAFSGDGPI